MHNGIETRVLRVVQGHTHYPESELHLDRHLEGELGIDSVVLAAIVASLRQEFRIAEGRLKGSPATLRELIERVAGEIGPEAAAHHAPAAPSHERASAMLGAHRRVIAAVQRHTGYPEARLRLDAHLEAELGIDSVVLAAILTDLVRELELTPGSLKGTYPTLGELVTAVGQRAAPGVSEGGDVPRAPVPDGHRNSTEGETRSAPPPVRAPAVSLSELIHKTVGASASPSTPFAAQGIAPSAVEALRAAVAEQFDLKPALRLEDCDTVEKLQRFVQASQPHLPLDVPPGTRRAPAHSEGEWDGRTMKDFVEQRDRDLFAKVRSFGAFYRKQQKEQLYWYGMPLESPCRNRAMIYDELAGRTREFLMFASNNYLGVANHPKVVEAICDATRRYGATNTGCRLIGGTNVLHKELERRLARFKQREACIVYPSGYSANLGCISALVKAHDAVVVDKFNHMSIVDGCKLSGGIRKIFQHNDMADLDRVLERSAGQVDGALIVVDGVFSMHGDICDLPELVKVAKRHGAKVLVDDAHSTGVLGKRGSGTAEHFGLKGEVDLELGTMSKALAGLGGFVCGDAEVVEYLRFYSNSYVFAANIPAGVAAGLIASIDVIEAEPERLTRLWQNIDHFKSRLLALGFDLGESESAIVPIVIGDDRKTLELGRAVRARGLFCQTVVYPGVSVGDARMRVSITSEHTREDLDLAVEIFAEAAKEVGVVLEPGRSTGRRSA